MKSPTQPQDDVCGPARITDDFVQTRNISTRAGAKKGWEKLSVYEREFRLGHLVCKTIVPTSVWQALFDEDYKFLGCKGADAKIVAEVYRAFARRDAAKDFDEGWATCKASWPSGSDLSRVRVVGCPGSFVDHQKASKDYWRRVEQRMGVNDWMICRRVCGEGYKVAETVISIQPGYRDSTLARFREALDALILGMGRAGKE